MKFWQLLFAVCVVVATLATWRITRSWNADDQGEAVTSKEYSPFADDERNGDEP